MNTRDIQLLYAYNRWANERVLRAAALLADHQLRRDLGSSFSSVWGTLVHIVWGEWLWLGRWQELASGPGPSPKTCLDLGALGQRCVEIATAQRVFVASLSEAALERTLSYENPPGVVWTYPLGQMLQHVVNHSTYHRGQVTTMLRQLGASAVATDFLVYIDELVASRGSPVAGA